MELTFCVTCTIKNAMHELCVINFLLIKFLDSEEILTRKVSVRFERPETDRSKQLKEKSFGYLQKKIKEEPWIDVSFFG